MEDPAANGYDRYMGLNLDELLMRVGEVQLATLIKGPPPRPKAYRDELKSTATDRRERH